MSIRWSHRGTTAAKRPRSRRSASASTVHRSALALVIGALGLAGCATVEPTVAVIADAQAGATVGGGPEATAQTLGPDLSSPIDPFDASRFMQRESSERRAHAELKAAKAKAKRIRIREAKATEARKQAKAAEKAEVTAKAAASERPRGGLVFGDSVALGAQSCLSARGFSADAVQSRTFAEGFAALQATPRADLPISLVVHLGTNGPFSADDFRAVMAFIGDGHHVTWVTISLPDTGAYAFEGSLNAMIKSMARHYSNTAIADWNRASMDNNHWFYNDMIHINGAGCEGFAETVAAVGR
jgi:hypothetical protein